MLVSLMATRFIYIVLVAKKILKMVLPYQIVVVSLIFFLVQEWVVAQHLEDVDDWSRLLLRIHVVIHVVHVVHLLLIALQEGLYTGPGLYV